MNDGDSQPGSGRFREGKANNVTADDVMVSAMSTLQLQLGSSVVRANCCSRFHRLMGDFLSVGGGASVTKILILSAWMHLQIHVFAFAVGRKTVVSNREMQLSND
jgi:hypothetical protein